MDTPIQRGTQNPDANAVYYTECPTSRPLRITWLASRNSPLPIRVILVTIVAFRKLIRRRLAATGGSPIPTRLYKITESAVLPEARSTIRAIVEPCLSGGFTPLFWYRGWHIGGRESYCQALMDETRTVYCTVVWLRRSVKGRLGRPNTILAFHSRTTDGIGLHTTRETGLEQAELIPPGHETTYAPGGAGTQETADLHRRTVHGRDLIEFTPDSAAEDMLANGVQMMRRLIAMKQLFPLTKREVRRLRPLTPTPPPDGDFVL